MESNRSDIKYLSSAFHNASHNTTIFLITKLLSILLGIAAVASGMLTGSISIFQSSTTSVWILVSLALFLVVSAVNVVFNVLGASKFGNLFEAANNRERWGEEGKWNYSEEMLFLNIKNIRNILWINLGFTLAEGVSTCISLWLFAGLIIVNIGFVVLVVRYTNGLDKCWREMVMLKKNTQQANA